MKMREIILDFTSLLDVIMIILFWFILNYKAQANRQINEAKNAAATAAAQAQVQQEEAEALSARAEEALAALADSGSVQASNIEAILAFSQNESVKLWLVMEPEGWRVDVYEGDTYFDSISDRNPKQIGLRLNEDFEQMGYAPDSTILCTFNYNGYEPDSDAALEAVTSALSDIKLGNRHFYWNENDLSYTMGE